MLPEDGREMVGGAAGDDRITGDRMVGLDGRLTLGERTGPEGARLGRAPG